MGKKKNDEWLILLLLLLLWLLKSGLFNLPWILLPGRRDKSKPKNGNGGFTPYEEPKPAPYVTPQPKATPTPAPTLEPYKIPSLDTLKKLIDKIPKRTPVPIQEPIKAPSPNIPELPWYKPVHPLEPTKLIKDVVTIGAISVPFVLPVIAPALIGAAPVVGKSNDSISAPSKKRKRKISTISLRQDFNKGTNLLKIRSKLKAL